MIRNVLLALTVSVACSSFADEADQCLHSQQSVSLEKQFDPTTGSDTRNYPPDMQVDFQHLKLEIDMSDPMSKSFTCNETLTFKTIQRSIKSLKLDCVELTISKVTDLNDKPLEFSQDDQTITIRTGELGENVESGVKISYACKDPKDGMIFAIPDEAYKDRPLSIHTQGETESNRHWFISHDYPNDRMTSEILVTIPSKYKALSNGALIVKAEKDGKTTWHYKLAKPHVSYLVSLVIGEFEVITETWKGIPVEYWVPPADKEKAQRTFSKTPAMMDLFSKLTGADYPYEKYAQSVVFNFGAGGMENTSTTTLIESTPLDAKAAIDQDAEGLISHELAHQWFGDMLTCKSWTHIWLNEGFATYMADVWDEHSKSRDEYDYNLWSTMRGVAESDNVDARAGVVFPFYTEGGENFGKSVSNPYPKGASALHMLRQSMGDDLFWKVISTYVKRNAWTSVETDDLRKVCDELSGRSYEQFFQQWLYRAGSPKLEVSYDWSDDKKLATIRVDQKQKISLEAPAFIGEVPVWIVSEDGTTQKEILKIDARTASLDVKCDKAPAMISFDPNGAMLKTLELDLPTSMLIKLAQAGPTTMSRLDAIARLATKDRDDVRTALIEIAKNDKNFYSIRVQAAQALGTMNQPAARDLLLAYLQSGVTDHKVRRAVIESVGKYRNAKVAEALVGFAKSDESYAIERAATEALGTQDPTDAIITQLIANCDKTSNRDQIRTAAVRTLAKLGETKGLEPAMKLASYGQPWRSRGTGFDAVAALGKSEKDKTTIRKFLVGFLDDPQDRAVNSAISALGELGDTKAIDALKPLITSSLQKSTRDRAKDAIDKINKSNGESSVISDLRERIEKLEKLKEKKDADK